MWIIISLANSDTFGPPFQLVFLNFFFLASLCWHTSRSMFDGCDYGYSLEVIYSEHTYDYCENTCFVPDFKKNVFPLRMFVMSLCRHSLLS